MFVPIMKDGKVQQPNTKTIDINVTSVIYSMSVNCRDSNARAKLLVKPYILHYITSKQAARHKQLTQSRQ